MAAEDEALPRLASAGALTVTVTFSSHCRRSRPTWVELAAGQVAAVDGDLRFLARLDHRRKDRVDPRRRRDGQAIEVFVAALRVGEGRRGRSSRRRPAA